MTGNPVSIVSYAALLPQGICTAAGTTAWDSDQTQPSHIKRPQILNKPYIAFGKLNTPDKLAFSVAALLLSQAEKGESERTGLILGIPSGSLSTDIQYNQSITAGAPSPARFSATLPSSPLTDIAIYFDIKGPDYVFCGSTAIFDALECATLLLHSKTVDHALFLAVQEHTVASRSQPNEAIALLLQRQQPGETTSATLQIDSAQQYNPPPFPHLPNQFFLSQLIDSLKNNISTDIPVSYTHFIGYIKLNGSPKDTDGNTALRIKS